MVFKTSICSVYETLTGGWPVPAHSVSFPTAIQYTNVVLYIRPGFVTHLFALYNIAFSNRQTAGLTSCPHPIRVVTEFS